jgi:inhibitor of cysteine peptidase
MISSPLFPVCWSEHSPIAAVHLEVYGKFFSLDDQPGYQEKVVITMRKSIQISAGILLICMAAVFTCGCTSPVEQPVPTVTPTPTPEPGLVYMFDQTNNNETYPVPLDAELQLRLPGNPTTGYMWQLITTPGIVIVNESYIPDDTSGKLVGSGGTYLWTMKAIQPGNQVLSGVYARPWESNLTGAATFTLTLEVGEVLTPPGVPARYPVYTEEDSGSTVNQTLEEEFNVRLAENPSTGYSWNMTSSDGLKLVRDEYMPSSTSGPVVGSGGIHSFSFKAVETGDQALHGENRRPWVPAGTVTFVDLEGGFYGITGDDGTNYYPVQLDEQYRIDGLRVAFEYEPVKDGVTIQMWGEPVDLTFIENITTFDMAVVVSG